LLQAVFASVSTCKSAAAAAAAAALAAQLFKPAACWCITYVRIRLNLLLLLLLLLLLVYKSLLLVLLHHTLRLLTPKHVTNCSDAGNAQDISIVVTATSPGSCSTATQQQLTAAVLQEVIARTPKEHASDVKVTAAVCSTSDSRRRQVKPKELLSSYTVLASTVGVLDDFATLRSSLQQALGTTASELLMVDPA
jgi:hypothetical protein